MSTSGVIRTGLAFAAMLIVAGCSSQPQSDAAGAQRADYVYVTLKTNPAAKPLTTEQHSAAMNGHFANIGRLVAEKKLLIAGPFGKTEQKDPAHQSWRGIFVINEPTVEQARAHVMTDPSVAAGIFELELTPMNASINLRTSLDLEKAMEARNPTPPGKFNIRPYVMITAEDAARTAHALALTPTAGRVVWCARFGTPKAGAGVFILDATDPKAVRDALAAKDAGRFAADPWAATPSLLELPEDCRR